MVAQGTTLAGRYRLDVRLGAGGMGEVWRGEDTVLARTVAVKVLLPGRLNDPGFAVRFQGEARAMATVNHPGVVDVYDYGVADVPGDGPTAYLVMRFVDGEPLDRLLARLVRIGPELAIELIAQAAAALQAVHERGIVHRDVKPGNLLVRSDGTLVLTDFGIARADSGARLTDAGMVLGTAAYCAPEQAEGAPVTPAVDIYALGVVAYECLAGRRPFDGDTPVTIALKHIREQPPPLPPDVPPAVRAFVERAMSKDPARRWPSAAAMSQAARQSVLPAGASSDPATAGPYGQPGADSPYGRPGHMAAALGLRSPAAPTEQPPTADAAVIEAAFQETGHLEDGQTYRVTSTSWHDGSSSPSNNPPSPTLASRQPGGQPGPRSSRRAQLKKGRRTRTGPIVAGMAGCVVVVGLVAAGVNWASAGSGVPEPTMEPSVSEVIPSPTQSVRRTRATRPPAPSRTPSALPPPVQRPSPSPPGPSLSPSPSPSASPSPSPSPSPSVKMVKVPEVKGLDESAARAKLTQLGFGVSVTFKGDGECEGQVSHQSPAAGTPRPEGDNVMIAIARKPCPSPSPSQAPPSPSPSPNS